MLHQLHEEAQKPPIIQSMLASTRERFALGSPPKDYNQNANEAINRMVRREKDQTNYQWEKDSVNAARSQLPRWEGKAGNHWES